MTLKISGEELLKSTLIVHVFIVETLMKLINLHSIMLNPNATVEKQLQRLWYQRVGDVIRRKVVDIGGTG